MPVKLCNHPRCGELATRRGRCAEHAVEYDAETSRNPEVYKTRRWRMLRRIVLRAEPLCRDCAREGRDTLAVDVDHIVPIHAGGAIWDRLNLQPLCKRHHGIKTRREQMAL